MLGGCTGGVQSIYSSGLWVQPGKYDYIKCPDIAKRLEAAMAQQRSVAKLMASADQEAAGPLINLTVYRAQLEQARADEELLRQTAREKKCDLTEPPAKK